LKTKPLSQWINHQDIGVHAKSIREFTSMPNKPTYKELEQRIKELEQDNIKYKRAEKKLRESESKYRKIINSLNEGFYSATLDGIVQDHNIEFKRILGLNLNMDFKGLELPDFWMNPEEREIYIDELMKNGFIKNYEVNAKKSNGEIIVIQTNSRLIRDEQGKGLRIEGSFLDITDKKNTENTLAESEERFSLAMGASKDGLWDWNITTNEAYYSPSYWNMLGYQSKEHPPYSNSWKDLIHIEDKDKALQANNDCIENRCDEFKVEFRMKAKNGNWKWIRARGKAVYRDINKQATRLVGTNTDITEQKKTEKALQIAKVELEVKVKQRTAELVETNTALKILLRQSEDYKNEIGDQILSNVNQLVVPFLKKIKNDQLNNRQINALAIAELNLKKITSTFSHQLSSQHSSLTPTEIQIANLLKEGKSSKEIAEITSSKVRTIQFHRINLRKKLGLNNKSGSLKQFLQSIQ